MPLCLPLTSALIALSSSPAFFQAPSPEPLYRFDKAKLEKLVSALDRPGQPGGALLVQRDGKTLYARGYGLANLEHNVRNRPSTVFKVEYGEGREFTAMGIIAAAEAGKLSLDDPVRKYIPELPSFAEQINIRHLIHHASGLPDYGGFFLLTGWQLFNPLSDGEFFRLLGRLPGTDFTPGHGYMYSNTDYALLAMVLQRATGKSLRETCREELFRPLGMSSTLVNDDYWVVVKGRAYDYYVHPEGYSIARREKTSPAGRNGVLTTVEDLAKWANALNEPNSKAGKLALKLREGAQFAPGKPGNYVFGHYLAKHRGLEFISHGGINGEQYVIRIPRERLVITSLTNGNLTADTLSLRVLDALFFEKPEERSLPPRIPETTLKLWLDLLAKNPNGVSIPQDEMRRLEGAYGDRLKPGRRDFTAVVEEGKLVAPFADAKDPITPLGNGVFHCYSVFMQLDPAEPGKPQTLKAYRVTTGQLVADQVKLPPPPTADPGTLTALAGKYYNPILDVTWALEPRGEKLFLKRERMLDSELLMLKPDVYELDVLADVDAYVFQMRVTIHRDSDGKPTHFSVSYERMKELKFARM